MSKARDLANAGTALTTVSATELGYVDGVTSAIQTQIDGKEATLPSQTGNSGKYLTTNGTAKSWGTVSQYALPSQTGNLGKYLTTNGTAESWGTVTAPRKWTSATVADNPDTGGANYSAIRTKIVYGNGYYVFAAGGGNVWASSNGTSWTMQKYGTGTIYGLAYGNGTFVFGSGNNEIYTATNPTSTWTSRTSPFSAGSAISEVTYVAGSINLFLVAKQSSTSGSGETLIASSPDGITWTSRRTSTGASQAIFSIAHNNSTIYTSATPASQSAYSTNGTTWTTFNSGTGETVDYIDGTLARFVALGSSGTNCISQTAANISTVWTTTPTTCFVMHQDNTNLLGTSNSTSTNGAPIYDSARNRYYMIGRTSAGGLYLNTYDASTLVIVSKDTTLNTVYTYKLIDSETLPGGWNTGTSNPAITLGYGNNKLIYAVHLSAGVVRVFYTDLT